MDQALVPRTAFYRALGVLLREYRVSHGFSQGRLAAHVGTRAPAISHIEWAEQVPSAQLVWNISAVLSLNPGALLRQAATLARQNAA